MEKIQNKVFVTADEGAKFVASEIKSLILEKGKTNKPVILGLATGSSPKSVYKELVRLHKEEGLSFENVITFNLDEYFPIEKDDNNSYHNFMKELTPQWISIIFLQE